MKCSSGCESSNGLAVVFVFIGSFHARRAPARGEVSKTTLTRGSTGTSCHSFSFPNRGVAKWHGSGLIRRVSPVRFRPPQPFSGAAPGRATIFPCFRGRTDQASVYEADTCRCNSCRKLPFPDDVQAACPTVHRVVLVQMPCEAHQNRKAHAAWWRMPQSKSGSQGCVAETDQRPAEAGKSPGRYRTQPPIFHPLHWCIS